MAAVLSVAMAACEAAPDPGASPLDDLQLVGVDFELNSMIISNNADHEVRTQSLWAYRDGESFEFDIFIVEPRATILFSMRGLGDISTNGGELALFSSDSFTDADSMLQYVVWGEGEFELSSTAAAAGLWPPDAGTVPVPDNAVAMLRVDASGSGPVVWEATDEID